jgi:hypothetical protein
MLPSARARLRGGWRVWLAVAAGVLAVAAPWFVYQTLRSGSEFWQIILGDHVVKRFSTGLDPTHLKPWSFYFEMLARELTRSHALWLAVAGGALMAWRAFREEWVEGALLLFWFWLPAAFLSLGSSKLPHYFYPFVPPLAVWAGYAVARVGQAVSDRLGRAGRHAAWGRVAQAAVVALLLAAGPARAYAGTVGRLGTEPHPMRTMRDCLRTVRGYQRGVGQRQAPLFVWLPTGYQHPFFYYFRDLGWSVHDEWSDEGLVAALEDEASLMAVLMPKRDYELFLRRTKRTPTMVASRDLGTAVMLVPGPMSMCGIR